MISLPNELRFSPYSHSKMSLFYECPHKWYHTYITKSMPREQKAAFEKGGFIHYALDHYPNPTPKKYTFKLASNEMQEEWVDLLKTILQQPRVRTIIKNKINSEFTWILDHNFTLGTNKWKSLIYGVVDGMTQTGNRLCLYYWKTGKSDGDSDQLKLYALWAMIARPNLKEVLCSFEYVERNTFDEFRYDQSQVPEMKEWLYEKISNIENATEFSPTPCKGCSYCPKYTVCPAHKITIPISRG